MLRNLLKIENQAELEQVEHELTWPRRQQLELDPVAGNFDLEHLREIHRILFQDIYDWAGQLRVIAISKGSSLFFASSNWRAADQYVFGDIHNSGLLDPTTRQTRYVAILAELLGKVNYLHPFRDGNGRAQRAFLDQIASQTGRVLSWRNVGELENIRASIESVRSGNGAAFVPLIAKMLEPPIDGLSPFEADLYQSQGYLPPH